MFRKLLEEKSVLTEEARTEREKADKEEKLRMSVETALKVGFYSVLFLSLPGKALKMDLEYMWKL